MSWWPKTTLAIENEITISHKDVQISGGQRAGFGGVLVSPSHYRDYSAAMELLPLCEETMKESQNNGPNFLNDALFFVGGIVLGVAIFHH